MNETAVVKNSCHDVVIVFRGPCFRMLLQVFTLTRPTLVD